MSTTKTVTHPDGTTATVCTSATPPPVGCEMEAALVGAWSLSTSFLASPCTQLNEGELSLHEDLDEAPPAPAPPPAPPRWRHRDAARARRPFALVPPAR